jgi:hypothetical protein
VPYGQHDLCKGSTRPRTAEGEGLLQGLERAHDHAVAAISRFVRATPSDDELEDDSDTLILGLILKARMTRIRAPATATAGPSHGKKDVRRIDAIV